MKKLFLFIAVMLSLNMMADTRTIDDILYQVSFNTSVGNVHNINIAYVMNPNGVWEEIKSMYDDDFVVPETAFDGSRTYIVMGVDMYAFYEADITSIDLPANLEEIGYKAFYGCSRLTSIVCRRAEDVYNEGNYVPRFRKWNPSTMTFEDMPASDAFEGVDPSIPVYVPDEVVTLYQSSPWGDFFTNILPLSAQTQALDNTSMDARATKHIEDGKLLIERDGKAFNALGAEVK